MLLDSVRLILNGTTSKNNDVTIFIQCFNCSLMDKVLTFSLVSQLFMKNFTTPLLAQETKIGLKLGGWVFKVGLPNKTRWVCWVRTMYSTQVSEPWISRRWQERLPHWLMNSIMMRHYYLNLHEPAFNSCKTVFGTSYILWHMGWSSIGHGPMALGNLIFCVVWGLSGIGQGLGGGPHFELRCELASRWFPIDW